MGRYLEINDRGRVSNVIVWDGVTPYNPDGVTLVNVDDAPEGCGYGWQLVDGVWVAPEPMDS